MICLLTTLTNIAVYATG